MIIIKVTQEHIDKGYNNDCYHCPVALALKEHFKEERGIAVRIFSIIVKGNFYNIPSNVSDFIQDFDSGLFVKPFEFEFKL